MTIAADLSELAPGFSDAVAGSQSLFRSGLSALSRPGLIKRVDTDVCIPNPGDTAAGALLLALLDQDTKLWLSTSLAQSSCASFLRFHTGCVLVHKPTDADFAWCLAKDGIPSIDTFDWGSDEYPDRSTTLVIQTERLSNERGWQLSGPGIDGRTFIDVDTVCSQFIEARAMMNRHFPRGIDMFFSQGERLLGLPRSTRIES